MKVKVAEMCPLADTAHLTMARNDHLQLFSYVRSGRVRISKLLINRRALKPGLGRSQGSPQVSLLGQNQRPHGGTCAELRAYEGCQKFEIDP